ncbi:MAG: hypothetical protein R3E77_11850 [Steroidobacteraceae bacterium]
MHALLAVTGRFQPLHNDHLQLLRIAFDNAERVIIGITNPEPGRAQMHPASSHRHQRHANPLTFEQRRLLVSTVLDSYGWAVDRYSIVAFPLEDPSKWSMLIPITATQLVRVFSDWERDKARSFAALGYSTWVIQGDPDNRISASNVRRLMRQNGHWRQYVHPAAYALLLEWQSAMLAHQESCPDI